MRAMIEVASKTTRISVNNLLLHRQSQDIITRSVRFPRTKLAEEGHSCQPDCWHLRRACEQGCEGLCRLPADHTAEYAHQTQSGRVTPRRRYFTTQIAKRYTDLEFGMTEAGNDRAFHTSVIHAIQSATIVSLLNHLYGIGAFSVFNFHARYGVAIAPINAKAAAI